MWLNAQVHEIKRLTAAIATIRSELNKYEEQLEDCRKYKDFLDNLTPPEFFKEQAALKARRLQERRARREEKRAVRKPCPPLPFTLPFNCFLLRAVCLSGLSLRLL